jgi:ribonuclease P protein component
VIVPKHRRSSTARNLLRRRLREITRVELLPRLGSVDLLIRAQAEAYTATFAELRTELLNVCKRLSAQREGD